MKDRGLTLVELVVVLAIVAILALLGAVSLRKLYCSYKVKSFSSELFSYMQLSRLFAMTYGNDVYILFDPNASFVAFYVDDVVGNGKLDSGESDHVTFPLPDSVDASELPQERRGSISPQESVKGLEVPDGICGITLTTTFSASQAQFRRDGTGKAGSVVVKDTFGHTATITVSIVGRVSLSK